jgi:hypothetical protein
MSQEVSIQDPPTVTTTITLRVIADTVYPVAAAKLGWTSGIPDLTITLAAADSAGTPIESLRTDSNGKVGIPALPAGQYVISATHLLTDAQRRVVAPLDLEAYAINAPVRLGQSDTATVMLYASLRGSLISSEWAFESGYYGQFGYEVGGFLEVYNNSDTTVYLDGVTIANGHNYQGEAPGSGHCADDATKFIDPGAVWAWRFDWFPGQGRDYPLAAGRTAVIATDAIDHRLLFPNGLNLSNADFEFIGFSDVDNPAIPNMINSGLADYPPGHGNNFGNTASVVVLARHTDIAALPKKLNWAGLEHRAIPRSSLVDVIAFESALLPPVLVRCDRIVDGSIVANVPNILGLGADPFLLSINRRVLYTRADGRKVLQHTRSSESDLILGPRTPGVIP